MSLIEILTAVVLVLASVLCIALIFYLGKITSSIKQVQNNFSDLSEKLNPLLSSLSELSEKLTNVSDEAINQLNVSREMVNNVKEHVDKILELEEKVRVEIEAPINKTLLNVKAITNGFNTFINHLKK